MHSLQISSCSYYCFSIQMSRGGVFRLQILPIVEVSCVFLVYFSYQDISATDIRWNKVNGYLHQIAMALKWKHSDLFLRKGGR